MCHARACRSRNISLAAKAMRLTVPETRLARADEVIEW